MVEHLGELLECVGVAVQAAIWMGRRSLGFDPHEAPLVLDGNRVLPGDVLDHELVLGFRIATKTNGTVGRRDVVDARRLRPGDHVDDGLEVPAQEHV